MSDFLNFKRMITPIIIQVIFWIGVLGTLLAGITLVNQGEALAGLACIVFGPLLVRVYCEILMVVFRINETLTEISNRQKQTKGVL